MATSGNTIAIFAVFALVGLILSFQLFYAARYKIAPADKLLVIYGKVAESKTHEVIHGGGKLVIPLIQDYAYLSLQPMELKTDVPFSMTADDVTIDTCFNSVVMIDKDSEHPAERLLRMNIQEIENLGANLVSTGMRKAIGEVDLVDIKKSSEKFEIALQANIQSELSKLGLILVNSNLTSLKVIE